MASSSGGDAAGGSPAPDNFDLTSARTEPLLRLLLLRAASRPAVARPLLRIRHLRSASRPAVVRPLSGSAVGREQGWGGRGACRIRSPRRRQQQHQATRLELEAAASSSSQHDGSGEVCRAAGKLWLLLVGEGDRARRRERRGGLVSSCMGTSSSISLG
ncbi:unnamed protein product [Urochloa humidicola]